MSNEINEALGITPAPKHPDDPDQPGKYSSLKNIAGIISILAWISGGIIFIIAVLTISNLNNRDSYYGRNNSGQSILIFFAYLYMGIFLVISLLAQSGIIKVLIDIAENTKKTNSK